MRALREEGREVRVHSYPCATTTDSSGRCGRFVDSRHVATIRCIAVIADHATAMASIGIFPVRRHFTTFSGVLPRLARILRFVGGALRRLAKTNTTPFSPFVPGGRVVAQPIPVLRPLPDLRTQRGQRPPLPWVCSRRLRFLARQRRQRSGPDLGLRNAHGERLPGDIRRQPEVSAVSAVFPTWCMY